MRRNASYLEEKSFPVGPRARDRETGTLKKTVEVDYGITDLTREQAGAKRLLELNRGHWDIENQAHYPRDVLRGLRQRG